jgi:fatty-acyl-CoA synthase
MLNIVEILRLTSGRTPDAPCTVWKGRRRTYSEMLSLVGSITRELAQRGVSRGACVVTAGSNSDLMLATYMANAALGGITVPLSSMLTLDEARDIVTRTGARHLVSGPEHGYQADQLAELEAEIGNALDLEDWERHADTEQRSAPSILGPVGGDSPAMIIFTSGSTGRPKGCVKTHANLIWHAVNRQISMPRRPADRDVYVIPPGGIGFGNYVLNDLLAGCSVILDSFDARRTFELIEGERATLAFLPPTMLHAMLNVEGSEGFDCSSLRAIETGYEMSLRLRERAVSRFGNIIWYGYGSSEGTISFSDPSTLLSDPKCVGRVCGLDEIAVVDENDQPVPDGVIGEIVGRGPTILPEYFDNPELTAHALRNGWYHSGDLGRLEPGKLLHFEGRIKDMIKSGGYNVAAAEVEEAIASHPAVSTVAVVGITDDYWGEAVTAAVVLSTQDGGLTEAELREYLRPRLARYKCPKRVVFLESLPLNPSGKVAKRELRRLLEKIG